MWDGRRYPLEPHSKQAYPTLVAEAFKRQNPVMGSEDPYTGEIQYLVGVEEWGDPLSNLEQSQAITKLNRAAWVATDEVVKAKPTGTYEVRQSLPLDSSFVTP